MKFPSLFLHMLYFSTYIVLFFVVRCPELAEQRSWRGRFWVTTWGLYRYCWRPIIISRIRHSGRSSKLFPLCTRLIFASHNINIWLVRTARMSFNCIRPRTRTCRCKLQEPVQAPAPVANQSTWLHPRNQTVQACTEWFVQHISMVYEFYSYSISHADCVRNRTTAIAHQLTRLILHNYVRGDISQMRRVSQPTCPAH